MIYNIRQSESVNGLYSGNWLLNYYGCHLGGQAVSKGGGTFTSLSTPDGRRYVFVPKVIFKPNDLINVIKFQAEPLWKQSMHMQMGRTPRTERVTSCNKYKPLTVEEIQRSRFYIYEVC